jgi:hypothetical protein
MSKRPEQLWLPDQQGRFLESDPATDVIMELSEKIQKILDKESLLYDEDSTEVEIRETEVTDERGEKVNMKVLVVQGEDDLDGSGMTLIQPPAWTDGPDTKGALRSAVTLSVMTGCTIMIPLLPGMGAVGADKNDGTRLTSLQNQSLGKGSYAEVAKMQWLAMKRVASEELGTGKHSNQEVAFFGYSLGNPQNAALLAEISENIDVVGAIWAENPDIGLSRIPALELGDLALRLKKSEKSPDLYGQINNIANSCDPIQYPKLDWKRNSEREFYEMLLRDKQTLRKGPEAVARKSVEHDLNTAREREILKQFGHLIISAGNRSTTLNGSRILSTMVGERNIIGRVKYRGEDHAMNDSLAMKVIMVREFLKRTGTNQATIS